MKQLYITSMFTGIALVLFFLIMTLVKDPLGGQPFSVLQIKDRQQAEKNLAKKQAELILKKRERKIKGTKEVQKVPRYFAKKQDRPDTGKTAKKTVKQKVQKNHQDQLEYIGKIGLPPAPLPELVEKNKYGLIPRIADDGRRALDVYARPSKVKGENLKTIALVVTGLGLSQPTTENAIENLPAQITLSFNPYARQLKNWTRRARAAGHELILEVPMEPFDYPDNDPGPHTLLSYQTDQVNIERLTWLMGRMTGYVGIINLDGSKFISHENAVYSIMREIKNRGLLYMDHNSQTANAPYKISQELKLEYIQGTMVIDEIKNKQAIDQALKRLEETAHQQGSAIGVASALPLSIQRLNEWASNLKQRGITLVPLTHMVVQPQS